MSATKGADLNLGVGLLALFFCLVPWASWGTNSLDSQPWPLVFSALYIALRLPSLQLPGVYLFLLVYTLFVVAVGLLVQDVAPFSAVRSVASYLTIPVVTIFFYDFIRRHGVPTRAICLVNAMWIVVGVVELFMPSWVNWMSMTRTTEDRGVTSLAAEPTYFAVYLIFSSWILLVASDYNPGAAVRALLIANLVSIVLLAQSPMGLVFLLLFLAVLVLRSAGTARLSLYLAFLVAAALGLIWLAWDALMVFFEHSRIGRLLGELDARGVVGLVFFDASINVRLEHAVLPIVSSFQNGFLPFGFEGYQQVRASQLYSWNELFWYDRGNDRIMSWVGAIVFDLGFLGLCLIAFLILSCRVRSEKRLIEILALLLMLFASIPLAFSLVPLMFALLRYKRIG